MTRKFLALLLVVLSVSISGPVKAQSPQEKIDLETINKIKDEGMNRSKVMDTLSYLTDVYGGRLTNSPNFRAASEWAKKQLSDWGLQNAHLEPWGPFGRGWSLQGFSLNVVAPQFIPLIAYPKAWSPSTNGTLRGEVVLFDPKTEADLESYKGKLKGAIVLFAPARKIDAHFKPEGTRFNEADLLKMANDERETGRRFELTPEQRAAAQLASKKWQMCVTEGAGLVLEPARGDGGTMFVQSVTLPGGSDLPFDQRPRAHSKDTVTVPQAMIASEHYNRIMRMLAKGVRVRMEGSITTRFDDQDLMSSNVIAEIPGTDLKDELVMLGAHFDSWHSGTGATDNGAGSAVCLEALRILQALGLKPRRTIRIGLWGGEEQGLLGSAAYVSKHFAARQSPPPSEQQRPQGGVGSSDGSGQAPAQRAPVKYDYLPEYEKFAAYFNLDNGTGKVRGVYMQGNEAVRPIFRAWLAPFKDLGASTLTGLNTGGTDHLS
ncbi:MAG TPA: M20/M25/M40 family metallo-hydrolase, partial [Blastocatellia bacterium]|nr:M20/M25/M40 family metallo-hydrolase [Blastocatellia bacterium]